MKLGNATILFASILAALLCAAEIAPAKRAPSIAASTRHDDPPPVSVPSKCALETWPNITTDCLRNTGPDRPVGDVRHVAAARP